MNKYCVELLDCIFADVIVVDEIGYFLDGHPMKYCPFCGKYLINMTLSEPHEPTDAQFITPNRR